MKMGNHEVGAVAALRKAGALLTAHDDAAAAAMATVALTEATLALVDQQRVANLIALGSYRIGRDDLPVFRHLVVEPSGDHDVTVARDIRKGLGL